MLQDRLDRNFLVLTERVRPVDRQTAIMSIVIDGRRRIIRTLSMYIPCKLVAEPLFQTTVSNHFRPQLADVSFCHEPPAWA
jgi:hypothetical protein